MKMGGVFALYIKTRERRKGTVQSKEHRRQKKISAKASGTSTSASGCGPKGQKKKRRPAARESNRRITMTVNRQEIREHGGVPTYAASSRKKREVSKPESAAAEGTTATGKIRRPASAKT